jgi:hypothetical protein
MDLDKEYTIIKNDDLYNYIYKFDINGQVEKCNKQMIFNKEILNDTFLAYFDICELLHDIKKSYKNNNNEIMNQFDRDYHRQNIILNNFTYKKEIFLENIKKYSIYNHDCINMSYDMIIILLCCQSTYELPYKLLMNIYDIDSITIALTCDSKDIGSSQISINTIGDKITIELKNKFLIKEIENNVILNVISVNLNLEIEPKNKHSPIISVFSWKYESA